MAVPSAAITPAAIRSTGTEVGSSLPSSPTAMAAKASRQPSPSRIERAMGSCIIGVFPGQNLCDKRTKVRIFTRSFDLESKASEEQGSRQFVTELARGLAVIQIGRAHV